MGTLLSVVKLYGLVQYLNQEKKKMDIDTKVRVKLCSDVEKREAKQLFSIILT